MLSNRQEDSRQLYLNLKKVNDNGDGAAEVFRLTLCCLPGERRMTSRQG